MNYLIIFILFLLLLLILIKQSAKPGILKNIRRKINTAVNVKYGYINSSHIKWCDLDYYTESGIKDITHPSVLLYKHHILMVATPYPQSLEDGGVKYENPYLFISHSTEPLITFERLSEQKIIAPLEAHYNSDPKIFMKDNSVYLLNRKCEGPDYFSKITLQKMINYNEWTKPIDIIKIDRVGVCPLYINYLGHEYVVLINIRWNKLFGIKTLGYKTDNIEIWINNGTIEHPNFSLYDRVLWSMSQQIYHADSFIYNDDIYIIFNASNKEYKTFYGIPDHFKYLWIARTKDFHSFQICNKPLLKRSGIYKPTAYLDHGILKVYFASDNSYFGDERKSYISGNRIGYFEMPFDSIVFD